MFFTPKAYVKIDFNCPHTSGSPEAEVLTSIFTHLLMDYLNDYGKRCIYNCFFFLNLGNLHLISIKEVLI